MLAALIYAPLVFILVLTALAFTPAREISILVGTIFGARLLSEGEGLRRVGAARVMVLGVVA